MSVTSDNELNNGTLTNPLIQNPNSHSTNLLALNHHLADRKSWTGELIDEQPLGSSRWNPTPEQLLALEEMYRRGARTPSAEEIQHIASQLRRFGKIEGKNVFYWFQNHKARERQKRRRREMDETNNILADKKESGLRKTSYDIEQTKNWAPSFNCSKHSEEFVPIHRAVAESSSCGPRYEYGWTQFGQRELQQRKSCTITTAAAAEVMNATWQNMEYKNLLKSNRQNFVGFTLLNMKPYQESFNDSNENGETQTLELFPLHSRDDDDDGSSFKDSNKVPITAINDTNNFTSPSTSQYFEFLPLKN